MEHAQRENGKNKYETRHSSLNPYFNGTCSKRSYGENASYFKSVLILILMEHAQREHFL